MDEPSGTMVNNVSAPSPVSAPSRVSPPGLHRRPFDWIHPSKIKHTRTHRLWSAINRNPDRVLAALIVLYLVIASGQAASKLLWGDELITLAIAQQWAALQESGTRWPLAPIPTHH